MTFSLKALALGAVLSLAVTGCNSAPAPTDAQTSPEKVVDAFYDALMAGDTDAALSMVAEGSRSSVESDLEEMADWTYTSVEVLGYEAPWVSIEMEIEIEGETDGGSDEVEVTEVDGEWWIVEIPS